MISWIDIILSCIDNLCQDAKSLALGQGAFDCGGYAKDI
jgi:hypothetical protein